MLNYDMAVNATATSIDSQNSAMREQEEYSKSLTARIERLKTEWTSFASTAGDAVLYDGIVVLTEVMKNLTSGGNSVVGAMGAIGPIFAIASLATLALSKNFRTLSVSITSNVASTIAQNRANGTLATTSALASLATAGLATAVRALLTVALPIGAAFFALGFAIEKVTSIISKNIQAQEEFDTYTRKNTEALTTNKEAVEDLISQYNSLTEAKEKGNWDSTKEQEYLKVQQTLSEMYPALIAYTDSAGQAHLKTSEEIQKEVEATEKLVKAQNDLTLSSAVEEFEKLSESVSGGAFDSFTNFFKGNLKEQIATLKNDIRVLEDLNVNPTERRTNRINEKKVELLKLEAQVTSSSDVIKGKMLEVANAVDEVDIDPAIQKNLEGFLRSLDVENMNPEEWNRFSVAFGKLQTQLQEAVANEDKSLYKETIKSLNELAKTTNDADFKRFTTGYDDMVKSVANGAVVHVEGEATIEGLGESAGESAVKVYELKDAIESMAGVSQSQIDDTADLIWQYETLTSQMGSYTEAQIEAMIKSGNLTSEEMALVSAMQDRKAVMSQLDSIYPSLLDKDGKAIKLTEEKIQAVKNEQKANEVLLKAYKLSRDGKLNAEQDATVASAKATKERINYIKTEIAALTVRQKAYQEMYAEQAKLVRQGELADLKAKAEAEGATAADKSAYNNYGRGKYRAGQILGQNSFQIDSYASELEGLQSQLSDNIGSIDSFSKAIEENEKATKKSKEAKDKDNKATEESIYLADKYKQKLEELNLAIQKQIALRENLPSYSDQYIKSLETQKKLEQDKLAAMEAQEASLQAQIKSGKIQETGLIKQESTAKSISKNLSGWSGQKTSDFGYRTHPTLGTRKMHEGIDIAGKKGTRLDANVSGKVVGQGYNSVSGNFVKIEDSQGYKHFYGHLDKAFVKLGDMVEAGTQIGNIGSTGRSTGAHLHYQVQDALGKLIDPSAFVASARNNKITTTSGGTSNKTATTIVAENAQSVDQAKSELIQLENDILAQLEAIKEVEANIRKAVFSGFENRRNQIDNQLSHEDAKLKNLDKTSERYNKTIDYQVSLMNKKQKVNEDEIKYLNELIARGGIPAQEMSEYKNRVVELRTEIHSLNSALQEVVNTQLELFDTERDFTDNNIEYYNALLEELDTNSNSYIRTLGEISNSMKEKQKTNESELKFLEQNIKSGKYSGEVLENLKNRYEKLVTTMKSLSTELRKMNYDIVINIKVRADEKIDDLDFQLQRSKLIQGMYDEGSADFLRESDYQISKLKEMAELQKKLIADIQREMKNVDLLPEDVKRLNETLEDATIQLYQYQSEILNLQKSASESLKRKQEEIADKLINAYKDYLNEMKDAKLKSIDDEIEAENKRHNIAMKNLADEMDRFQRAIDEKRKALDRGEAERGYNMEIDDLEKERNKLQDRINLLALDDSHGAKADKKKLEEQLAKIERDIAEKRHQRQLELQKQGLDDLLDLKEDEIEGKEELENKYHDEEMKLLDEKKKYYTQYYNDMLNNERKFAEIRKQILAGDFEALREEFGDYLDWLESTMPDLENTLDGTMSAVGTSIRQNIIDNLREALDLMNDIANTPEIDGSYGSSSDKDNAGENFPNRPPNEVPPSNNNSPDSGSGNSGNKGDGNYKNLTNADLEVLLGKFIREKIAPTAPAGKERDSVKYKGDQIAAKGRRGGSQILESESLSKAMSKLSSDDILKLSNFTTYNFAGITSEKYKNQILKWSNELRRQASLNGGGLLKFNGRGIDGIGGKQIIAHDGEVVSTPLEVDKIVNSTSTLERIMSMAMPLLNKLPNLPNLNLTTSNRGMGDVTIQLNGAIYNSNNRTAHDLVNEMADALKTQGRW